MNNEIKQLTDAVSGINSKLETVVTILNDMRNGEAIRNLAMSNFVQTQEQINNSHTSGISELTRCLDSWFEAEGKLKKLKTGNN